MKKKVIFFARAYNDIDCRLPLLLEFAKDKSYFVIIVVIPTNNGINDLKKHELFDIFINNGIQITNLFYFTNNFIIIFLFQFYIKIINLNLGFKSKILKILSKIIFYFLKSFTKIYLTTSKFFERNLPSSFVIIDEIIYSYGRSFFVDILRDFWLKAKSFKIFSFITGQDTYINLWHDKKNTSRDNKPINFLNIPIFVPGPNDKVIIKNQFPNEKVLIVGNTRFDRNWINYLHTNKSANIFDDNLSTSNRRRIVFMLSKMEYGVNELKLIDTINEISKIEFVEIAIKPHTRGMQINQIKNLLNPKVFIADSYSSTQLINWCDYIFFTGSSIVFQGIILNKIIVFLSYCQNYQTIFDDCEFIFNPKDLNDAVSIITDSKQDTLSHDTAPFLNTHIFNNIESGLICKEIKSKIELYPF